MLITYVLVIAGVVGYITSLKKKRFPVWVYIFTAFLGAIAGAALSFGDSKIFLEYAFLNIWTVPIAFSVAFGFVAFFADRGDMVKTAGTIVVIIAAIIGLFYIDSSPSDYSGLFREGITFAGVRQVGQPIEGFDAFLLMQTFPGFTEEDFDGVKSLEGVYSFDGTELAYRRTASQPVTSAEQTISGEGYETLLSNLSRRLGVDVKSESDVSELVETLSGGDSSDGGGGILPYDSGIRGTVLLGPTCPVVQFPPESGCDDRPYQTTISIFHASDTTHTLVTLESGADGAFEVSLPPGDYVISASGGLTLPYCSQVSATVGPSAYTEVTVSCDTGIR